MNTSAVISLEEEDLQLRSLLDGKRLICEVPFDRSLIEQLRDALFVHDANEAWRFPNVAAIVTVGTGVYEYQSGDYWDALPHLDSLSKQTKWKKRFESFLEEHPTLEAFKLFREQKAHRYVAAILAHGGVPESCLVDLFETITVRCSPDQTGAEALEYFQDNKPPLTGVSVTVVRFIEYGGETAEELIGRLLALWKALEAGDSNASLGLPRRIRNAFCDWYRDAAAELNASARRRFPGPAVFLDPRTMSVTLSLPPCDQHPDAGDTWDAFGRSWPSDLPNEIEMPIAPGPEWDVTCGCRVFHFHGVDEKQPAIFFDPSSGRIIRDPTRRRLPEFVWALYKENAVLNPLPDDLQPFVQWPGYVIAAFDLEGHHKLNISGVEFDVRRPIFRLDEGSIRHDLVARDSGIPVVSKTPKIDWNGEANLSLSKDGQPTGNIEITSAELPFLIEEPGEFHLELRGSFGQNLQLDFLLLPGIAVTRSPSLAWPDTEFVEWTVEIPGGAIYRGGSEGRKFRCYEESIELEVEIQDTCFPVVAAAPRLEWRLNCGESKNRCGWSREPVLLREGELSALEVVPILTCRLSDDHAGSTMVMEGSNSNVRIVARPLSVRGEPYNYWLFDLGIVHDQLLNSGAAERFELVVGEELCHQAQFRGHILEVRPEWDLSGLQAECSIEEDTYFIRVGWLESGHAVEGRWLTMQPVWRPREGDIRQHRLGTEETRYVEWEFPQAELRPGRYRICAVQIPWAVDELGSTEPQEVAFVDVHKEVWSTIYSLGESSLPVEAYVETVLAHLYRPELVPAPKAPLDLDGGDIEQIMEYLQLAYGAESFHLLPQDRGPLPVFCLNASATSLAAPDIGRLPEWLCRCLPPEEIMRVRLGEEDRKFLVNMTFHWEIIGSATTARFVAMKAKPRKLCEPLRDWRKALLGTKTRGAQVPPIGLLIFLCERDQLLKGESPLKRAAYEALRNQYLEGEYL